MTDVEPERGRPSSLHRARACNDSGCSQNHAGLVAQPRKSTCCENGWTHPVDNEAAHVLDQQRKWVGIGMMVFAFFFWGGLCAPGMSVSANGGKW